MRCPPRVRFLIPVLVAVIFLLLGAVGGEGKSARAASSSPDEIIADVSDRQIAVTAGFTGATTTLFGALPESGDVIVVVAGPPRTVTVRRKERVLGVWLNRSAVSFRAVPGFYWVASSRPLQEIATPAFLRQKRIGAENLRFTRGTLTGTGDPDTFATALLTLKGKKAEIVSTPASVSIMGQRLYRADLTLPDSAPTGEYTVTTYLMRNKALIGQQDIPLTLRKEGSTATLSALALRYPVLYAGVAILLALFSGWASALLGRVR